MEGSIEDDETMEELVGAFLDQIHVAKAFNSNHQILLAEKAKDSPASMKKASGPSGWSVSTP